jgi:MmyB-like transcription regulator ligand binding domain
MLLVDGLPDHLLGPPMNVFRVSLHPDGMAARTQNFEEWSKYLLGQLHRSAALTGDSQFERLIEEFDQYPNLAGAGDWRRGGSSEEPQVLVPLQLTVGTNDLSLFTTVTVFGTPQDITLSEMAVELFYPSDDATESTLRSLAADRSSNQ